MNPSLLSAARASCVGLALFVLLVGRADANAARVWIDADPSIGSPFREVDDAYALVFAFHSPELQVAGISTTYGNAGVKRTTLVSRDLVKRFGAPAGLSDKDVHEGCASPRDFGKKTAASEALARALRHGKLTYLALGPLSNLASFLALHPELASRIERVIFVGGRSPEAVLKFGPRGRLRIHDANVFKDTAAVRRVLESNVPILLAPVEASRRLMLSPENFERLRRSPGPGEYLAGRSRAWMWFWTRLIGEEGGPLFDVLPLIVETRPKFIRPELRHAFVDKSGELIAAHDPTGERRAVRFCTGMRKDARLLLVERLVRPNPQE